jgi:hypothetical protein
MRVGQFLKNVGLSDKKLNYTTGGVNEKGKKIFTLPKGYPNFTPKDIISHNNKQKDFNAFYIYLKDTGFVVLDCDDNISIDFVESLNLNTPFTKTTKGRHYYIKLNQYEFFKKQLKINDTELDIITDYISENINREMYNYDEIDGMIYAFENKHALFKKLDYEPKNDTDIKKIVKIEKEFSQVIPLSINQDEIEKIEKDELFKMIDKLDAKQFNNYKDWCSFMYFMVNQSKGGDIMDYLEKVNNFLSKLENYDEMGNVRFFMDNRDKTIGNNTGLIYKWLRRDNIEYYNKIASSINKNFDLVEFNKKKDYTTKKLYFEKFVFKVLVSGKPMFFYKIVKKDEFKEYSEDTLKTTFKHLKYTDMEGKPKNFMTRWTDDAEIKYYEDINFYPTPVKVPDNEYNLYNGLRAEKDLQEIEATGDISRILKHIYYLSGENQTNADYLIKMLAHRVKFPGCLPRVGVVFKSKQGVGKNLLADFFGNCILGSRYYICDSNADTFLGRFGCGLKNKLLCVMNEVSGKDTFGKDGILKNFITDPKVRYEAKNVNHIMINNYALIWFFTNNDNPISIEPSDRRFVVFDCSDKTLDLKKDNYFKNLVSDMKDEIVQKTFYDYLMNIEVEEDYNFCDNRPITEAYKLMKKNSTPIMISFFTWFVENQFQDENIKSSILFEMFNKFKDDTKTKCEINANKFGCALQKYPNVINTKNINNRTIYNFNYDKLIDLVLEYM